VIYQPIVNSSVRLTNLQAGSTDLVETILPSDVDAIKKNPKLRLVLSDALGFWNINFNVDHGPRSKTPMGQDPRIRHAFELALDREAITQVVYGGMYDPTAQAIPRSSPFYAKDVVPPPRDVARAKALLAEAGVKLPFQVSMMLSNSPDIQQVAEVMQSMVAEAGFDLKLQVVEFASSLDTADRGDFDLYYSGWSGRPDPDGNLWNFVHSGSPLNYSGYASADVDQWLEAARATTDIPARAALYAKVAMRTQRDLPVSYIYAPKNIVGMSAKLTGFSPVPDGLIRVQDLKMAP
jgi:peptide/nickel transport system substrate-binding protein